MANKQVNIAPGQFDGNGIFVAYTYSDTSTPTIVDDWSFSYIPLANTSHTAQLAYATAQMNAYATTKGYTITNTVSYLPDLATISAPGIMSAADKTLLNTLGASTAASYQTIVTQAGTAAPAISGGFSPINTYSGTPTFTWARTSTGVYTLTAGSAIFNTSGKTGIFMQMPNNPLANFKAVVTSTTVITITTTLNSILTLILTPTATDALLSNTMIYVQTYP